MAPAKLPDPPHHGIGAPDTVLALHGPGTIPARFHFPNGLQLEGLTIANHFHDTQNFSFQSTNLFQDGTSTINSQPSTHFAAYDGNGNVMALVDAGTGLVTAQYEYGPFGELLRATGPMAKANPFRFSTKYQDDETDLLYYGYRFLDASIGRWVNRDPIEERGGLNVYTMTLNAALSFVDLLGLVLPPPISIVGPDRILALDKSYPDSQQTRYRATRFITGRWRAGGMLRIIGPHYGMSVNVAPSGESSTVDDSSVGFCDPLYGWLAKKVTIIRPARISRPRLTTTSQLGTIMDVNFYWTITDQLGTPLGAGVRVTGEIDNVSSHALVTFYNPSGAGTDLTDNMGRVSDRYYGLFSLVNGYRDFTQTFIIGTWRASVLTRWQGNGQVLGGTSTWFH